MNDALPDQIAISTEQIPQKYQGLNLGEPELLLEVVSHITLLAVLSDYVAVIAGMVYLLERDDVAVLELLEDGDFAFEHAGELAGGLFAQVDHLYTDHLA